MHSWQEVIVYIEGEDFSLDDVPPEYREDVARGLVRLWTYVYLHDFACDAFDAFVLASAFTFALCIVLAPLGVPADAVVVFSLVPLWVCVECAF